MPNTEIDQDKRAVGLEFEVLRELERAVEGVEGEGFGFAVDGMRDDCCWEWQIVRVSETK